MKNNVLLLGMLLLTGITFISCSKNNSEDDDDQDCEISVASVAGKYKLVSAKRVEGSGEVDVLNEMYESCELDDTNELKADKTFIYTDAGITCSPAGNFTGTWDINGRTLKLNTGLSNIESFNCKELVVTFRYGPDLIKETYRRQ